MRFSLLALLLLLVLGSVQAGVPFHDGYAEAVSSGLTGLSTDVQYRAGLRSGQAESYLYFRADWYDTTSTNLPFQYTARGTTLGAGYRYWLPGNHAFVSAGVGEVVDGRNQGKLDARLLAAGFYEWRDHAHILDLYDELSWVGLADDTYLSLRGRDGWALREQNGGRLWAYGIGQVYASGTGTNGTENRLEAGLGIGYLYRGRATLNLELRHGYSFRGTINDKSYWNPMVIAAGSF